VLVPYGGHAEFDTVSETWEPRASYPRSFQFGPYVGSPRGVLTVAGGDSYGEYLSDTYTWNPDRLEWEEAGALPEGRAWGAAATAKGRLFVIDGYGLPTLEYDPDTRLWSERAAMPADRYAVNGAAVMEVDGHIAIHVPGGMDEGIYRATTSHLVYRPAFLEAPQDPHTLVPEDSWVAHETVELSAELHEGHGQPVRLEVEVTPADGAFTGWPTAISPYGFDGPAHVTITGLAEGDWKWQARARNEINEELNSGGWIGPAAFHVDRTPPATPAALSPRDLELTSPVETADVRFEWSASSDSCPLPLTYDVQVSNTFTFDVIVAEGTLTGVTTWTAGLSTSPHDFFWRVRARDGAGNPGAWSAVQTFRLTLRDGINHGGGDAVRNCGFGAQGHSWLIGLFALLALRIPYTRPRILRTERAQPRRTNMAHRVVMMAAVAMAFAGCGQQSPANPHEVALPALLADVRVEPHIQSVQAGAWVNFQAIGILTDGRELPIVALWSVSDPAIATVDINGNVTGVQEGPVEVIAVAPENPSILDAATLTVTAAPPAPPEILTTTLGNGRVGQEYYVELEHSGGSGAATWSVILGTLPPDLFLDEPTGVIYGAPSSSGSYTFTVQLSCGGEDTQELTLYVESGGSGGGGGRTPVEQGGGGP